MTSIIIICVVAYVFNGGLFHSLRQYYLSFKLINALVCFLELLHCQPSFALIFFSFVNAGTSINFCLSPSLIIIKINDLSSFIQVHLRHPKYECVLKFCSLCFRHTVLECTASSNIPAAVGVFLFCSQPFVSSCMKPQILNKR